MLITRRSAEQVRLLIGVCAQQSVRSALQTPKAIPRFHDSIRLRIEESIAGNGQIVMIAGEPGIGKTRLAHAGRGSLLVGTAFPASNGNRHGRHGE